MQTEHKREFAEIVTAMSEVYGKTISKSGLMLWWQVLEDYTIDQVRQAFAAHARDTERGTWMPRPADIIRHIDGEKPNVDQIIGMALKPSTPLGVLCRIEIGSWNLENWTADKLRPLAQACLEKLPELKARVAAAEFAEHEIAALERYGITDALKLEHQA